jgi:uncharacterized DUF497 family protein
VIGGSRSNWTRSPLQFKIELQLLYRLNCFWAANYIVKPASQLHCCAPINVDVYNFGCTNIVMGEPFDETKEAINVAKHSISLARVSDFVEVAVMVDDRFDYGETRYRAWGHIDGIAYYLAFTFCDGEMRPISLRRAHAKEMKRYVKKA